MQKGTKSLKLNKILLVLVCLVVATTLSITGIYAKYVYNNSKRATVMSPAFYFSSDLLLENGKSYTLNPGTDTITFSLYNFDDSLRYSDSEVNYTLETTNGTLSSVGGEISGGANSALITLSGLEDGITCTVKAVGTMGKDGVQGFKKTLSATFTVKIGEPKIYMYADLSDDYLVTLTVWTEALAGSVRVDFPENLIPDNTCEGMETVKIEDGEFTTDFIKYSSRTFRFLKTAGYVGNNFVVTLTNGGNVYTATTAVPV